MIYKRAGAQLHILRVKNELTQIQLAEILRVSQNFLSDVERGKRKASLNFYIDVANYFKVTLDYLFSDSLNEKNNILIDSVVLKMNYMDEKEQEYILNVVESFTKYTTAKEVDTNDKT